MVGQARCIVEDPQSGPTAYEVAAIDAQGVTLKTLQTFGDAEFIDVALELAGAPRQALFAQIAGVAGENGGGLKLRWMHMDPSDEQSLQQMLEKWQAGEFDEVALTTEAGDALDIFGQPVEEVEVQRSGTRRVTRPKLEPVNDEADQEAYDRNRNKTVNLVDNDAAATGSQKRGGTVRFEATPMENRVISEGKKKGGTRRIVRPQTEAPAEPAGDASVEEGAGTKRKTRRIVKPGAATQSPPSAPAGNDQVEDPSGQNLVLTQTGRISKGDGPAGQSSEKHKEYKTEKIEARSVTKDGKLDVNASIRNSAKTVSASELASKHDKLKVLNMSTIKGLIQSAVSEAMESVVGAIDEKEKDRLLKEAEEGFKERLESFKAEKKGMEAQAKRLREQLDRAQELLEEEKHRKIEADQFTMSDSGIADLEKQFERMMKKASKSGSLDDEMEGDLRKIVNKLLDDERDKIAEQARKAQSESIELLERKVQRLAGTLQETEKERDAARRHANELAASGGGPGGVQNMYDVGLADDDANREAKLALLKDVFDQNKEMREHMEKKGIKVEGRKKPPRPKKVEPKPDLPPEDPVDDVPAAEADDAALASGEDDMVDPDDMPWEPGRNYNPEADFEDGADDAGPVKKISVTDKEPPRLERRGKAAKTEEAASDDAGESSAASDDNAMSGDPDDMPWEPGASDAEDDEEGASAVKKISIAADSEPPPLKRKKS